MNLFTFGDTSVSSYKKAYRPFLLFIFFLVGHLSLNAQYATDIFTDFGGFWHSSLTNFSTVIPNKSHDVVGFTFNGITYSTGVNNSLLTTNGVTYTPGNYKTLPFSSIAGNVPANGGNINIAQGEQQDGVASGFSNPLPVLKAKDALTDGVNGLNIGTGVTNLPSSANMVFPAQIISTAAITDNQPDIIFAQMTGSATSADVLVFQDASGHTVGKSNSVQWNLVKPIGNQNLDFYKLTYGATIDTAKISSGQTANTTQTMRLLTISLSDFGITAANAAQVKSFVIKPAGSSDPAFIAYNTEAIYLIPPAITQQPQSRVVCTGTGQSATFTVSNTGLSVSYQWQKNGVDIPGATSTSYTINSVTASDVGYYQVVITNSGGVVVSTKAFLNTTITAQPTPSQSIVTGNDVILTVAANNGLDYQWQKDGVDIPNATESSYFIHPLDVKDGGTYRVNINGAVQNGCAAVMSDPAVVIPVITVYSTATGDFNVPATWGANTDGSGSTPVDFTRAEHTFVLSNRKSANTLTDVTIAGTLDVSDGIAVIAENTTLDVGKCIRSGGGSISGSTTAGFKTRGTSTLYFTQGFQNLKSFTIAGGTVTMLTPLNIGGGTDPGTLNLTNGVFDLNGNKITLRSTTETNTSMVTTIGSGASINYGSGGAFVAERFIPAHRAYRFISPAVTTTTSIRENWMESAVNPDPWTFINRLPGYGTHITGPRSLGDSLDATRTYNPSMFYFNPSNQSWVAAANSHSTLKAGHPVRLMVRGSRAVNLLDNEAAPSNTTLRATGTLVTGTYNVGSDDLSPANGAYSFIGNPYASPVNWNLLPKTGISSTYYTWDEKINKRGSYVAYNGAVKTNSEPSSLVNENIQSGQGFFVKNNAANPTLTFDESSKTAINRAVFRGAQVMPKLTVQLLINKAAEAEMVADGVTAAFDENFSKQVGDEDSYKFTNLDENIAISENGTSLAIDGRPNILDSDTLSLKLWQLRQKDYFFKINFTGFETDMVAFLKDEYLGIDTTLNVSGTTLLPFSTNADIASYAPNRFSIIFKRPIIISENVTDLTAKLKDDGVELKWKSRSENDIESYEVQKFINGRFTTIGTTVTKPNNGNVTNYTFYDAPVTPGTATYRIKIIEKAKTLKYTEVVSVWVADKVSRLTIYPNPASGKIIGLKLKDVPGGTYKVTITDNAGRVVYTGSINVGKGVGNEQLELQKSLATGNYSIRLTNGDVLLETGIIAQ